MPLEFRNAAVNATNTPIDTKRMLKTYCGVTPSISTAGAVDVLLYHEFLTSACARNTLRPASLLPVKWRDNKLKAEEEATRGVLFP